MINRTDDELLAIYRLGHAHNDAEGLRAVYEQGRADVLEIVSDLDEEPIEPVTVKKAKK
jgi:hypothetical protein